MVVLSAVALSMALPRESLADTEMTIGPQGRTPVLQRMLSEIALISNVVTELEDGRSGGVRTVVCRSRESSAASWYTDLCPLDEVFPLANRVQEAIL
jgi:hypothetical protein